MLDSTLGSLAVSLTGPEGLIYLKNCAKNVNVSLSKRDAKELQIKMINFLETEGRTNVHVMCKASLDKWLIPTLRVVPRLVEAIETGK